ncbi:MAG: substrate-binding domain-containing protein [Planctomycetota bacterium]
MRPFGFFVVLLYLSACGGELPASGPPVVGVSLPDLANRFFKDLEAGLRAEAEARGMRLQVRSAENDPTIEARHLRRFVEEGVAAIVLAPCRTEVEPFDPAGIPVFSCDIAIEGVAVIAHVASENRRGGELAAAALQERVPDGKFLLLDNTAVSSVRARSAGFRAVVGAERLAGTPDCGGDRARAEAITRDYLDRHAELRGIFGTNDLAALGALRAVEAARRDDVVIVGFDFTPDARQAMLRGSALRADVRQDPARIGRTTIETIARHRAGETVERNILIPVELVTAESLR